MLKSNTQRYICFFIVSILVFSIAFVFNSTGYLSNESDGNFDWWSESLIYSDLIYSKEYPNENTIFNKSLIPSKLVEEYGGELQDYENQIRLAYQNSNNQYKKSDFVDYKSNIVIQRYLFRFLDSVLPFSNNLKIHLFHFINCLLLSISISIIICWIIKVLNSFKIGIGILALFSLFAPNLIMYGKNLYWCAWTLFLPFVMMILLLESNWYNKSKHKILLLSFFALLSITIKCLFYFEFISVVMISMMIPVIYYILNLNKDKYSIKKKAIYFFIVSLFAVVGFLLVMIVKLLLLNSYYGDFAQAFSAIFGNIADRLLGNTSSQNSNVVESANVSVLFVIDIMIKKTFLSIKSVFSITQFGLILSTFISTVILILMNKKFQILSMSNKSWIICCWISFLAPISWFILAKPHTFIHNHHCTIVWFVIFNFMSLSLIGLLACKIVMLIKSKENELFRGIDK
ncbi:MAG: hypothetical protein U0L20_06685 [Ruminococcus sp.]|nr:hypothetical protein [Ruminococcus sp.]